MSLTRFLRGQVFDPELVTLMSEAFDDACRTLALVDPADPAIEAVARHIIQLVRRGIRTKAALYFMTIDEFKPSSQ